MQRQQKTLESFHERDTTESEEHHEAQSRHIAEHEDKATYDDLIGSVLDDENIRQALRQVVGNKGAPGIDGMSVFELQEWLPANIEEIKAKIRAGKYKPKPVRRVEIPKPDGGTRTLGVPTALDRLLQQAVAQVLTPIYEPLFSESSFGFRPNRSAQDAILRAKSYIDEGYSYAVDLDLSKFFDTLNQGILMDVVRETVKDKAVIELVKRFVKAGAVLPDGLLVRTDEGTPQGGPLSPILANIYLDRFDKLLESRGLHFIRYADDIGIFVKSPRAAERVMQSCTNFLEGKQMKLKVNLEKSSYGHPRDMKFLGFKLIVRKGEGWIVIHPKSIARLKKKVRCITKRNKGRSFEQVLNELRSLLRGWVGYFGICSSKNMLESLDKWISRRVRQYLFKQWKKTHTRFVNLKGLCPPEHRGPENSVSTDWIRQCWGVAKMPSHWKAVKTQTVHWAMNRRWLAEQGLYFLSEGWDKVQERCSNRRVPNGTHGGVRGRLANQSPVSYSMCAQHGVNLGGESPLQAWQWELLAEDKGVHREMESEGSRRQNPEPTNRKCIVGMSARARLP